MFNLKIIIGGARPGRLFTTPALMNMPATQPATPVTPARHAWYGRPSAR